MKPRLWTIALLTAWAAPLWADTALTPHSATYKVKISVLGGLLHTELRETGKGYAAKHVIVPTGMSRMLARGQIEEKSTFEIIETGVKPIEYSSRDSLSRDKETVKVTFDWETSEAHGTVNGEEVVSEINGLAHDRVSIQYEVMQDLLNGEASDKYTMFEIDRLRPVNVKIVGEKSVDVPAGEFDVIGIQHQAEGSKRVTTLWCAKELDYLPVIIEQHRKGKLRVRATLMEYEPG